MFFVRWLKAFRGKEEKFTTPEIWAFENSGVYKEYAAETVMGVKKLQLFSHSIQEEGLTVLPKNKTLETVSTIPSGIGLRVKNPEKSFVSIYADDAWTEYEGGKLIASRGHELSSSNYKEVPSIASYSYDTWHNETIMANPDYDAIIVKGKKEQLNDEDKLFLKELQELSGLPVIETIYKEYKEVSWASLYRKTFSGKNILSEEYRFFFTHHDAISKEIPEEINKKLEAEDKYEEFVEDIDEEEEE